MMNKKENTQTSTIKILYVENDPNDVILLKEMLSDIKNISFDIESADCLQKGFARYEEGGVDIMLLDLSLPDSQGLDTFLRVSEKIVDIPIIVLTGLEDKTVALEAIRQGAEDYLVKGQIDGNLLTRTIHYAIERVKIEKQKREAEEKYRILFEQSPNGIIVTNPETTMLIDFNTAAHCQLDYSREEFAKLCVADIDAIESQEEIKSHAEKVLREGKDTFETKHRTKNGEIRNVLVTTQTIKIAGRKIFHTVFQDITDIKCTEEKLRKSEERYKTIFENTNDAIFIVDMSPKYIEVNQVASNLTGYSREELMQMSPFTLNTSVHSDKVLERIANIKKHGHAVFEVEYIRKDGTIIPIELSTRFVEYEGQPAIISIARDITDRKIAELEKQQKIEAEIRAEQTSKELLRIKEIEKLKDDLTGFIVHDLRSPLTAIKGYLRFISQSKNLEQRDLKDISSIEQSVNILINMTANLLDVTKMESRKLKISCVPCNISDIITSVIQQIKPQITAKSINFFDLTWDKNIVVKIEKDLIRRVILNILSNAIRFVEEKGEITIGNAPCELTGFVLIFISDTGIGIAEEYREKIFDKFATIEMKKTGHRISSGLGLTFCKLAIELHGGTIWVEEREGGGSIFKFTLPV